MPEGPSIVILKEAVQQFSNRKVLAFSGNSKQVDFGAFTGKKVTAFASWGKHFLICFPHATLRIHFMLFGSYRINEEKETPPRLQFRFTNGTLSFYACSVKVITTPLDEVYDWSADVMNPAWDAGKAIKKLKARDTMLVCDALLDQDIFAGVGNIIKNEVLYRTGIHPLSTVGHIPLPKLKALVKQAVVYSFDFLKWKKAFTLKQHWQVHTKSTCPVHHTALKKTYPGKTKRRTFYCEQCQELYS